MRRRGIQGRVNVLGVRMSEPNEHPARKWKENIYHFRIDVVCVCVCATAAAVSYYRLVWIAPRIAGIAWRNVLTMPQHTHTHNWWCLVFLISTLLSIHTSHTSHKLHPNNSLFAAFLLFWCHMYVCDRQPPPTQNNIYIHIGNCCWTTTMSTECDRQNCFHLDYK